MSNTSDSALVKDEAVEALLENARPRPAPPADAEREIRAAVSAEWEAVSRGRTRRRQSVGFAIAASIAIAVTLSFFNLRDAGVAPVQVASIERSVGTLYLQSDDSSLTEAAPAAGIFTGQVIATGADSIAGLSWHDGGSLRVSSNTRIEFVDTNRVYLHSGKIYFDSSPGDTGGAFTIQSDHGQVSHVGTQYMTEVDASSLVVSVREGRVNIDRGRDDVVAFEGQRVQMTGGSQPIRTNISGTGDDWRWIETVSPKISIDGMSVYDFLHWVGRETGNKVRFATSSAEELAKKNRLQGSVNADPRTELRIRMMTDVLDATIDAEEAEIVVTD